MVLFLTLSLPVNCFAGQNWIIVGRANDGSTYQYDKNSIREISHNLYEVQDGTSYDKGPLVRQIRINCEKKQYAIGQTDTWVYDKKVSSMNFSKNGWVWFNTDGWMVDLVDIVCPGVALPHTSEPAGGKTMLNAAGNDIVSQKK